jgi:hypothetical protein
LELEEEANARTVDLEVIRVSAHAHLLSLVKLVRLLFSFLQGQVIVGFLEASLRLAQTNIISSMNIQRLFGRSALEAHANRGNRL